MADRNAVSELFATYGWASDTRDPDLVGQVLADDPTFGITIAGERTVGPLHGRDEIVQFFADVFQTQSDQRRHVITNFRYLDETDDTAHVRAYLSLLITDGGVLTAKCTGVYDTHVVRVGDAWRFASIDLALDSAF
jgi:uncharacterized protein (TIGR02246 family)